ncbi:hypothetical protein REIFOR_02195 [Reinekea forsetii]|uniref:Uncharacterized protein n=1 Tax=Reinekea forsetii TaxID=1336806 RepID=A0A2K8KRH8_9GAMM|nr:hypothetical protein REIFOR_02195 [Reinekea forsetii]
MINSAVALKIGPLVPPYGGCPHSYPQKLWTPAAELDGVRRKPISKFGSHYLHLSKLSTTAFISNPCQAQ